MLIPSLAPKVNPPYIITVMYMYIIVQYMYLVLTAHVHVHVVAINLTSIFLTAAGSEV